MKTARKQRPPVASSADIDQRLAARHRDRIFLENDTPVPVLYVNDVDVVASTMGDCRFRLSTVETVSARAMTLRHRADVYMTRGHVEELVEVLQDLLSRPWADTNTR